MLVLWSRSPSLLLLSSCCIFITRFLFTHSLSMPSGRVVVVGSANQDLTTYTSVLPQLGETIMGDTFQTSCGGKGANQACASASLGMAPVSMVCRVGKDVFGEALLGNFRRLGVEYDADTSVLSETSSGVAAITVDQESGDNMIIVTPGANHALTPSDVEDALKRLAKNSDSPPAVVVVQLEIKPESALQALKTGKELGAITILNPAPAPEGFSLEGFYPFVDILIPNESELQKICGSPAGNPNEVQMAESLLQKGVGKALVVTLGARGAMTVEKDGVDVKITMVDAPKDLPARKLPIKDTVGAGDGFCGALATYLAMGLTLSESAGKACGVASMSVRRQGASYPTWDELPDSLKMEKSEKSSGSKPTITFVTGNKKKLEEVQQILGDDASFAYELTSHKVDLPELQGDPVEIAKEKCKMAATKIGGACMTEDTSLCFNALNSMPGPYIKWFLDSCGHDGLNGMLSGFDDKTAYAQTVVAFTEGPDSEVHVFDGRTNGKIVPPRGSLDFGWDPIFEPDEGNGKTYAEMPKADKNSISHRGRSFAKLKEFLAKSRV